ncbi:MAG TPA: glycosyl hydrolase family 67, partial [Spirochaetes bacterium]|nr:glycosyl hydrolase family 67 [Spirochaetota bacterium]
MNEKLYIVDTTGPFFVRHPKTLINWSKVPYENLEKKGAFGKKTRKKIKGNFEKYIDKVASLGFNAVSMDELSRLVIFPFYPPELKTKLEQYRRYYRRLFGIVKERGLKIFITTDIMFHNPSIEAHTRGKRGRVPALLKEALEILFIEFPEVDGVIFRMGESDGVDVEGDFKSRLYIKTPAQANRCIKDLLPIFERYRKLMIFRTWTIGAHKVGDLMWNRKTYDRVFQGVHSARFIVSMKYGDSDFFRYLKLNSHFFNGPQRKIIELQARREYEGFGAFPSFTGWDYHEYYRLLQGIENLAGIHVWCQTGGWSRFRNFTFLKNTSPWNELNTVSTLKIFKDGCSVREAVSAWYRGERLNQLMKFLALSDQVVKWLLYDPALSHRCLYFNRVRIPPL